MRAHGLRSMRIATFPSGCRSTWRSRSSGDGQALALTSRPSQKTYHETVRAIVLSGWLTLSIQILSTTARGGRSWAWALAALHSSSIPCSSCLILYPRRTVAAAHAHEDTSRCREGGADDTEATTRG